MLTHPHPQDTLFSRTLEQRVTRSCRAFPALAGRIHRAAALVQADLVWPQADGTLVVQDGRRYIQAKHAACGCADGQTGDLCCHWLAAGLYLQTLDAVGAELTAAGRLATGPRKEA